MKHWSKSFKYQFSHQQNHWKIGLHNASSEICNAVVGFCIELLKFCYLPGYRGFPELPAVNWIAKIHIRNWTIWQAAKTWHKMFMFSWILTKYGNIVIGNILKGHKVHSQTFHCGNMTNRTILHATSVSHYKIIYHAGNLAFL